jgi:hypothetical protein
MTSPKLLLALMATVSVQAAPQINEREVVGEVIQSLGPAIQQALASLGSSSSSSSGFGSSPVAGRVSATSSVSRPQTSRRNTFVSAPTGVTRSASGPSVSSVTSSVVSALQPSIAAAVVEALKASSRPVSRPQATSYKAVEEPNYGPAKYNFGYKVADEESQAYINHQESREGNDVTGSYNYVNPAGALVTVNYEAGVDGFSQTRDVEQGAVQMRNIPGAWTGPLAGLEEPTQPRRAPATTSSIPNQRVSSSSSQASQEALIAQILSSIQPKISSAVQGALSASKQTAARRTVAVAAPRQQAVRVAAPRPIAPRPRPGVIAPSSRRVAQTSSSRGNLGDVFGNGETSVKFATPQFQFEF